MENTQPHYNPPAQGSYPQQPWQQQQQPPAKKSSKKRVAAYVAGAFALVIFGAAVGGSGSDGEASTPPAVTVTAEAQPAVTVTAEAQPAETSTPESCIRALDLGEELDAVKSGYIQLVGQHFSDEADVWEALAAGDMDGVDLYWQKFEQMNAEADEKVAQVEPLLQEYSAASLECRGEI